MTRERGLGPPLSHRVSFGLGDLKSGRLGESWLGRILFSRRRVNYTIKSQESKELVVHHKK